MNDDRQYLTWEVWSVTRNLGYPLLLAAFSYQHDALTYGARMQVLRNWSVVSVVEVDA
jgi:hypothetical protein